MSGKATKRLIEAYIQEADPTLFLTSLFRSPPENFYSSKSVELDIVRYEEDVSIAIQDLTTGHRFNTTDIYTNKEFVPPIHSEAIIIDSFELLNRMPGQDPFVQPEFRANVITLAMRGMRQADGKIRRSMELQASQVLQTGIVTLTDENGDTIFSIDYSPKATHFVTVGTAWNTGGATPLTDIDDIAEVIRGDGLSDPNQLIMGSKAYSNFIANSDVQQHFDNRRIDQGTISGFDATTGGSFFRGMVTIGNYQYDIFTYGGKFKDPQTGVKTDYLDPNKVIVRVGDGRLDATFGAIPNIGRELGTNIAARLPELPGRISNGQGRMDLFTNIWTTADGSQLLGSVSARPLMIPTAIDTFGTLTTV